MGKLAPAAKLEVSGEVKIGETGLACSVTTKGSIRYNTTSVLEFCNGTGWNLIQAAACTDPNPSVFLFTNQPNATASSLTASDIIQISGINCSVPVTISGQGSPEYQICSDSGCSTVLQGWTSGPSSISNGQIYNPALTTDSTGRDISGHTYYRIRGQCLDGHQCQWRLHRLSKSRNCVR